MNKTALGFGIGLVLIAAAAVGYLALTGAPGETPAPTVQQVAENPVEATPAPEPAPADVMPQPPADPSLPKIEEPPARIPQPEIATPTQLAFIRTVPDAATYASAESFDVNVRVEHVSGTDPVRAMGMQETIPAGFVLESFSGPRQPEVKPAAGHRGILEFAWIQFPEDFFPAEFSYRLKKDGAPADPPQITGQVLYRTSGNELRTEVVNSLLGSGETVAKSPEADMAAPPAPPAPEVPANDPNAEAAIPKPVPATLTIGRAAKAEKYAPGAPLEFDVVLEHTGGPVGAVAVVETLPPGWTFDSITGGSAQPPIKPAQGATGNLSFIFVEVPSFPATFTYKVVPPADAIGEVTFRGKVAYRSDNQPLESGELVTTLTN